MPKLTYYKPDGSWGVSGVAWRDVPIKLHGPLHKLMEMEHTFERQMDVAGVTACQFCERRYDDINSFPCSICPATPKGRM